VAMAHAVAGGRSVLMLRSTRTSRGKVSSNILWNYAHTTIPPPRHRVPSTASPTCAASPMKTASWPCCRLRRAIPGRSYGPPGRWQTRADFVVGAALHTPEHWHAH
jgi:hypothetical protein